MKLFRLGLLCIFIIGLTDLLLILSKVLTPHIPTSHDPLKKITIGRVMGYPDLALIAQNNGYFKKNGLDVTFQEYDSPSPLMKDILASNINIVSATAEFLVVSNSFRNEPLKIIAVVSTQDKAWEVIARKDKNIHNIADLKGKKIGVQYKTVGGFLLGRFISYYGLGTDVEINNLSRKEYTNKIAHGDIDAVTATSPFTKEIKKLLGKNSISWSAQPERSVYGVSYTTSDFIIKNPDVIKRYLRSLIEAEEFVEDHNAQAQDIMQKQLRLNSSDMDDLWPKFEFTIELPQELFIMMEDEARWMVENKLTDSTKIPNFLDDIYFTGLEAVKPEAITAYH